MVPIFDDQLLILGGQVKPSREVEYCRDDIMTYNFKNAKYGTSGARLPDNLFVCDHPAVKTDIHDYVTLCTM